jgi:hypothetical protein
MRRRDAPLSIDGVDVSINRYFLNHPEMVLGAWTRKDTLYGEGCLGESSSPMTLRLMYHVRRRLVRSDQHYALRT